MWGFWSRLRLLDALGMGGCDGGAAAGAAEDIVVVEFGGGVGLRVVRSFELRDAFRGMDGEVFAHGVN